MNLLKASIFAFILPLFMSSAHKYYVSVTQITYVKEKASVQMISRIDIADLEYTLQERYDATIKLTTLDEDPMVNDYIKKYLNQKIDIKINTQNTPFRFIGKEYENDLIVCYLEIENVKSINTIEISNMLLFDLFPKQKNVVKTKINSEANNLIFTTEDQNQYLNFK
ncbi:hypothetical protein SAMN04515667_1046 [Formosa sp. Hel1_31_208]|uniref:DUF6702 family protein n=1 Tax=Formosa sp. Hel1_31_208 TaxID=1798225 RepID=UPI00087B591A|nr:DUF6702 family protein [Formosa sp. Hel1_31_208]SDR94274.1 hypothetical protein SAMN04515667_1046 [Formosa sp. Hel1_31_208]